jgi:flagellar protein FlbD
MIVVTRLHGSVLALNCDLIERVEATPRTILTMVDGSRYVVRESVAEIVDKVRAFRASVIALAHEQERERLLLGDTAHERGSPGTDGSHGTGALGGAWGGASSPPHGTGNRAETTPPKGPRLHGQ